MAIKAIVAHGTHDLRVEELAPQPLAEHAVEVRVVVGGICGSDLHYFHRGGVGDFTIREPLVLGHEVSGVVTRCGRGVCDLEPGTRVAIDPSVPCGVCRQCRRGARNLCTDVRFLGSAARMPHSQGGFRERLVVDRPQCLPLPDHLEFGDAVFAEPLAVALHAVGRAGPLLSRDVLITGAGPIGMLILLAALHAGAASVTVTDIAEAPLSIARQVGATAALNVAQDVELADVDVAIEASAAASALDSCVQSVRPGGRVVLVGLFAPGQTPFAANRAVTREINMVGSFRFTNAEFRASVDLLASGLNVSPLLTGRFPFEDAVSAFEFASQREQALKVQVVFAQDGG